MLVLLPILGAGLVTMHSFSAEAFFFERQFFFISLGMIVFFAGAFIDFRFLNSTKVVVALYLGTCLLLIGLLFYGELVQGAQRWLDLGFFRFQPSDPAKLVLIVVLAKYFSKRHVNIADFRHVIISGFYTFVIAALVFLQPDLGSAFILIAIWAGMLLVSGVSKKHIAFVLILGIIISSFLWTFALTSYQKQRVETFLDPYADLLGSGYNAYQSTIAVGSGQILGKGIGFGSQSRLKFLPESETDFIFASFAEEWGFVGVILLFSLFLIFIVRILLNASYGHTNFEVFFGVGLAILFISHFLVHVGANIGMLPVTGTTLPFMSYGGSHILTGFIGLSMLMGMRRYRRVVHRQALEKTELLGTH